MQILTAAQTTYDVASSNYSKLTISASDADSFTVNVVNDDNTLSLVSTDDARANAIDATHRTIVLYGGPVYRVSRVAGNTSTAHFYGIPA